MPDETQVHHLLFNSSCLLSSLASHPQTPLKEFSLGAGGLPSGYDAHMLHWSVWVCYLALAPNSSKLPVTHTLETAGDGSSDWFPTTHMENLDGIPSSSLRPGPVWATECTEWVKKWITLICLLLSLSLCLPNGLFFQRFLLLGFKLSSSDFPPVFPFQLFLWLIFSTFHNSFWFKCPLKTFPWARSSPCYSLCEYMTQYHDFSCELEACDPCT